MAYRWGGGPAAAGRYLYLRPDVEEREIAVRADDPTLDRAFTAATGAVLGAWEAGAFFPRVVDIAGKNEPGRCAFCTVAQACLRGDSGARGRLFDWADRDDDDRHDQNDQSDQSDRHADLLAVWRLPAGEGAADEETP